jgi:hypothetical protein
MVGAFEKEGVTILAGTDSPLFDNVPGASLQEEIALLHQAGLTAENALAAATTRAAAALPGAHSSRLAVGEPADLVLLRNDPILAIETGTPFDVAAVVVDGRVYSQESLSTELRDLQQFFRSSTYSAAVDSAVRWLFPGTEPTTGHELSRSRSPGHPAPAPRCVRAAGGPNRRGGEAADLESGAPLEHAARGGVQAPHAKRCGAVRSPPGCDGAD